MKMRPLDGDSILIVADKIDRLGSMLELLAIAVESGNADVLRRESVENASDCARLLSLELRGIVAGMPPA